MQRRRAFPFLCLCGLALARPAQGQGSITPMDGEQTSLTRPESRVLVEEFTASCLAPGEFKIGSELEYGLTAKVMFGTDMVTTALGAPTLQGKWAVWENGPHKVALGFRAAYLSKDTLLWGGVREYYDQLKARMVRPQLSWSHELSPRLTLHTFWSKGLGSLTATLSEQGRRDLWEAKHPGAAYDKRDLLTQEPTTPAAPGAEDGSETAAPRTTSNQEKAASKRATITTRTTQVQSIAGLAQERFQITGEFIREGGNKILVTSRIEQTQLEQLRSSVFRLTASHHWIWDHFQMRLGFGAQYFSLSGRDLDGELADDAGIAPASDLSLYLRF